MKINSLCIRSRASFCLAFILTAALALMSELGCGNREPRFALKNMTVAEPFSGSPTAGTREVWKRDHRRPTFARVYIHQGNSLELVSLQVTVNIEGPRASTLVDHIFRNPHDRQLEGTFEYPLPTGASPSYFAMFLGQTRDTIPALFAGRGNAPRLPQQDLASLTPEQLVREVSTSDWGTFREARIVSKEKALETYEDIVRGKIDPALLEYAGGNTFRGRVFPIPARGYNRVLIAYEELLPYTQDKVLYRFGLPNCRMKELQFTLQANATDCLEPEFNPPGVKKKVGGDRFIYTQIWTGEGPGGEVQFAFFPVQPEIQAISGRQRESGPLYVYARLRRELKIANARPFADHAIFLLDTSLSEHPDRFAVSMKLLRRILETDSEIKHFNVLAFNIDAAWIEPHAWLANTASDREKLFDRLDGLVLEGATDLSAALAELAKPSIPIAGETPLNIFLFSDGQITWGETDCATLVARFEGCCPFPVRIHCYRTGLGAENLELFGALTRKGGGIFNCFTEADLTAASLAHRTQCFQVEKVSIAGGPVASDILVAGGKAAVYPGGELIIAARVSSAGRAQVVLEGTFEGQKLVQKYSVEITAKGELAPRGWAEIAVASLLALNDPRHDSLVTAYCQQFGIAGRVASFLVLENDADYKRFNLEEERGKTVQEDFGRFLDKKWKVMGRLTPPREAFQQFLARVDARAKVLIGPQGEHIEKLLALISESEFEVTQNRVLGKLLRKIDVPLTYLEARDADPGNVEPYLAEARRRIDRQDPNGAVRVLSSVIEEHAGRADALRLVGYRLLELKQLTQAVGLFQQVQRNRPFEPHCYRDLARSLEECRRFGLAAIQYEILLAGAWHNRFRESLKLVAQEEYAHMMQEAIRDHAVSRPLADYFRKRLEGIGTPQGASDLRITISWNTDATDVDLWVIEPDGTKCFYQHPRTQNGGELSQDQTQGYGPERYLIRKARPGTYTVIVHNYRANPNLLAGETHVQAVVSRDAGRPGEMVERYTVILKKANEQIEVCKIKF